MSDNSGKIIELQNKLEMLLKKHTSFQKELNSLRSEIQFLKTQDDQNEVVVKGMPPETHHVKPAGYQEKPALKLSPSLNTNPSFDGLTTLVSA